MANRSARLQIVAEVRNDEGLDPDCTWNTEEFPGRMKLLDIPSDYEQWVVLSANEEDRSIYFSNAHCMLLCSNAPFTLKLGNGETELTNLRVFVAWAADLTEAVGNGNLLISNPSATSEVNIQVLSLDDGTVSTGAGAQTRNVESVVRDTEGRFIRINWFGGTYRTLTYVTTTGTEVDLMAEYTELDVLVRSFRANYDGSGLFTGWTTP